MTKTLRLLVIIAAVLLTFNLQAAQQKKNNPDRAVPQVSQRKELDQFLDDFKKAMRAKDLDAIMSMYDPNVVAYDINPPGAPPVCCSQVGVCAA